jgi:hypothetical protein
LTVLKIDDLFIVSKGIMKRYVIYDSDMVWSKAYKTFDEACAVVIAKVNSLNAEYIGSSHYDMMQPLPSSMTNYDMSEVNNGILVATINDEMNIFIQMIDVD